MPHLLGRPESEPDGYRRPEQPQQVKPSAESPGVISLPGQSQRPRTRGSNPEGDGEMHHHGVQVGGRC
nr:hypothetical protein [Microvenator marinus]